MHNFNTPFASDGLTDYHLGHRRQLTKGFFFLFNYVEMTLS